METSTFLKYRLDTLGFFVNDKKQLDNEKYHCKNHDGITDPYGELEFVIGSGDDFICFDYHLERLDAESVLVIIDAVINSETGSFIQSFDYYCDVIKVSDNPVEELRVMIYKAIEWCWENEVKYTKQGWNQDPWYVYRSFCQAWEFETKGNEFDDKKWNKFSDRQFRFGGKRIDRLVGLE